MPQELAVHGGTQRERERLVALLDHVQIGVELVLERGVRAIVDDQLGALVGILAAQVGDALFGDQIWTECSLWSMWLTSGTMVEILPPFQSRGR